MHEKTNRMLTQNMIYITIIHNVELLYNYLQEARMGQVRITDNKYETESKIRNG